MVRIRLHIILLVASLILFAQNVKAQVEFSARLKNQKLKVTFYNNSDTAVTVPDLAARHGRNAEFLYESYYSITNDTLALNLKENVDKSLYTIRSAESHVGETTAKLKYSDHILMPGKSYSTKIKLPEKECVKFLKLVYEGLKLEGKVN